MTRFLAYILFIFIAIGCSSSDEGRHKTWRLRNQKGEYIYRKHDESYLNVPPPTPAAPPEYPWQKPTKEGGRK